MIYFKTSQPVPGRGSAWMYYECTDDRRIVRFLTHIPATGEVERVEDPVVKTIYRPEFLEEASREEFEARWREGRNEKEVDVTLETKKFEKHMTVGDALRLHPKAGEVLAAFHLGGCSHCGINEAETIEQVTAGYGVDTDMLLESLNGLLLG